MKFPTLLVFSAAVSLAPARAAEDPAATPKPKPGPVHWIMRHVPTVPGFGGKKEAAANWQDLALTIALDPARPKLAETRQMKVTIRLTNKGRKLAALEFPTSQRFEVVLRNAAGKVVERWSDDHAISKEPALVTVNPGERLEYLATLATRDMAVGQACKVEVAFVGYEALRATKTVTAE